MIAKDILLAPLRRLSARERLLAATAIGLMLVVGLIYGGILPGIDAKKSAASRHAAAIASLSEIRSLAARLGATSPAVDPQEIALSAETAGFRVTHQDSASGSTGMTLEATDPQAVLRWVAANTSFRVEEMTITPLPGGARAQIRFTGERS